MEKVKKKIVVKFEAKKKSRKHSRKCFELKKELKKNSRKVLEFEKNLGKFLNSEKIIQGPVLLNCSILLQKFHFSPHWAAEFFLIAL